MLALALVSTLTFATPTDKPIDKPIEGVSLTVYSSADPRSFDPRQFVQQQRNNGSDNIWAVPGYGVVKVVRKVAVPKGIGTISFTDVAAWIDPTTVSFTDLDDAATTVLEQNFQFDLVSPSKLMERYIGRTITLAVPMGNSVSQVSGELLSANQGQLVLKTPDGLQIIPAQGAQVSLGEMPGGLLTKPTLVWKLASDKGGEHLIRTTYQTAGITWRSDYNIVIDGDDKSANLTGWVTLMNLSGASYENANLKLVAGDVHKIQPQQVGYDRAPQALGMRGAVMADVSGFVEKAFADFHLYSLPRTTDVLQNSTQQIALFPPTDNFKVKRELVFDFANGYGVSGAPNLDRDFVIGTNAKPSILVSFENKKDNALGMPLPAGKMRVYKMDDADGTLEFIGEDLIDHTPRNETVKIHLGEAFDVVGERTRTDFTIDNAAHRMTESFKIEVRNQKAASQKVRIVERLYRWTNWSIDQKNTNYEKLEANTIEFNLDVPPEGSKVITYRVVYTW